MLPPSTLHSSSNPVTSRSLPVTTTGAFTGVATAGSVTTVPHDSSSSPNIPTMPISANSRGSASSGDSSRDGTVCVPILSSGSFSGLISTVRKICWLCRRDTILRLRGLQLAIVEKWEKVSLLNYKEKWSTFTLVALLYSLFCLTMTFMCIPYFVGKRKAHFFPINKKGCPESLLNLENLFSSFLLSID